MDWWEVGSGKVEFCSDKNKLNQVVLQIGYERERERKRTTKTKKKDVNLKHKTNVFSFQPLMINRGRFGPGIIFGKIYFVLLLIF